MKYIKLARFDHWGKNLFMLPGVALALSYTHGQSGGWPELGIITWNVLITFVALGLISSANYTLNEWLDRGDDAIHPYKSHRAAASSVLSPVVVYSLYVLFALLGLTLSLFTSAPSRIFLVLLLVMGIVYNVKPIRTKDVAYLDVISESVNNPIRLAVGWYAVTAIYPVPASAFLAFWGGGIFLMGLKRYSEMATVKDRDLMISYRKSFKNWTLPKLLTFSVSGALTAMAFLGILLAGYRLEYVLLLPILVGLFHHYLRLALEENTATYQAEKLWKSKLLVFWVVLILVFGIFLTFWDWPLLHAITGFELHQQ